MVFIEHFLTFSLKFGGGSPRKTCGNHQGIAVFSVLCIAKPCFFHEVFVVRALAKQWKNQGKTVHFSKFFMGKNPFFFIGIW